MKEKNILEKLSNIQNELKAPKGQRNSFGNYNFRSAEDIIEAVKPICKKYRTTLTLSDELVVLGTHTPTPYTENIWDKDAKQFKEETRFSGSQRFYIKATATLYDLDDGESKTVTAYAREEETKKGMDGSQITGTASSYARKYALNGLFNIDDTKDADTDEYQKQTKTVESKSETKPVTKPVSKATAKQIEMIKSLYKEEELKKALDIVKKNIIEDLTVMEASSLISQRKTK